MVQDGDRLGLQGDELQQSSLDPADMHDGYNQLVHQPYCKSNTGKDASAFDRQNADPDVAKPFDHNGTRSWIRGETGGVEAIILAAGRGSRLGSAAEGTAKCLAYVGGRTLLERQLDQLEDAGVDRVTVVVGYCAENVRAQLRGRAETIFNPVWANSNSLYSLWLCRESVSRPFIVLNCDVLAHPEIVHRLLDHGGSAFSYDADSGDDEEHMKVEVEGGVLKRMSKALPAKRSYGENVGIIYFDQPTGQMLFRKAEEALEECGRNGWLAEAVERVARDAKLHAVEISDLPWAEIDFPEDLDLARRVTWPAMCATPCGPRARQDFVYSVPISARTAETFNA